MDGLGFSGAFGYWFTFVSNFTDALLMAFFICSWHDGVGISKFPYLCARRWIVVGREMGWTLTG